MLTSQKVQNETKKGSSAKYVKISFFLIFGLFPEFLFFEILM